MLYRGAGGQGFEPQPSDPESDVLPIKLSPILTRVERIPKTAKMQQPDVLIIATANQIPKLPCVWFGLGLDLPL